ncbi:hypothetical protein [Burkholderia pseudomallei]|uniref:hypothetical protein n=1 Tax=Burkholderia pseudomallei TaxID=28450 RepID=UPI0012AECAA8|nr:hypothetical protein [Burkholderia pseudomallei]
MSMSRGMREIKRDTGISADSAIRMCCRLFDAFGKGPADQGVECPMLSLSTSLPTKIVEKAAAPARCKQAEKRRCALAAMAGRTARIERHGARPSAFVGRFRGLRCRVPLD